MSNDFSYHSPITDYAEALDAALQARAEQIDQADQALDGIDIDPFVGHTVVALLRPRLTHENQVVKRAEQAEQAKQAKQGMTSSPTDWVECLLTAFRRAVLVPKRGHQCRCRLQLATPQQ